MASQSPDARTSPRILIVRLSAIGDVIHGMPIACALRERFPRAYLGWVVEERAAELLQGHEALDELIVLPRGWLRRPRLVWQLRRRLRAARFDLVLEAQGLTKAAVAAWLSGAKRRIGFGGQWGRELSPWLNTELVDASDRHAVLRNLALLEPLGIRDPGGPLPGPPARRRSRRRRGDAAAIGSGRRLRHDQRGGRLAVEALAGRSASPPWPLDLGDGLVAAQPGRLGQRGGTAVRAEQVAAGSQRTRPTGPQDDALATGRAGAAGKTVRRLRHRSAAPGGRGRHALRRAVRPLAGRETRSLWSAARRGAKDVHGRLHAAAPPRAAHLHGSHRRGRRLRRLPARSFPAPPLLKRCRHDAACGNDEMPAMLGVPGGRGLAGRPGVARLAARGLGPGRRRGAARRRTPECRPSGHPPDAPHRHLQHPRLQGAGRAPRRRRAWPSAWKASISSPSRKSTAPGLGRNSTRRPELGKRLGLAWLFAPNTRVWHCRDSGNGLLSALPVEFWQRIPLANYGGRGFRNAVLVGLKHGDRTVRVLLTHISAEQRRGTHRAASHRHRPLPLLERAGHPAGRLELRRRRSANPPAAGRAGRDRCVAKVLGDKDRQRNRLDHRPRPAVRDGGNPQQRRLGPRGPLGGTRMKTAKDNSTPLATLGNASPPRRCAASIGGAMDLAAGRLPAPGAHRDHQRLQLEMHHLPALPNPAAHPPDGPGRCSSRSSTSASPGDAARSTCTISASRCWTTASRTASATRNTRASPR